MLYPGYVLVEMEMDDTLWHAVKDTPRVTGFVGGGNHPVPLTADEVNQILYRQQTSADKPKPKQNFERNETVRIIEPKKSSCPSALNRQTIIIVRHGLNCRLGNGSPKG